MTKDNIYELIGNTPLVRSRSLVTKPGVRLYFKMEGHNPGGSVQRPACSKHDQKCPGAGGNRSKQQTH